MNETTTTGDAILLRAEFDARLPKYFLLVSTLGIASTFIGILFLPFWLLGLAQYVHRRQYKSMGCELTPRALNIRRGYLFRTQKNIPLDKITDVGLVQGPIMRYLDLETLSVETAGQSSQGPLVKLIGIQNTRDFRDAVLRQRDEVVAALAEGGAPAPEGGPAPVLPSSEILVDIRDTLHRIEKNLADREMTDG